MEKKRVPILLKDQAALPEYATDLAAGADVRAHIEENLVIEPGSCQLIPTGVYFEIPEGYEIQVRPRSGLAFKHQITVLNSPGTIDADYRGELKVLLINHGTKPFTVERGMRIAQIVLSPIVRAEFEIQESLAVTNRGEGGFGHTGIH